MDIFKAYVERYLHIKGGYAKIRKMYLAQIWKMDVPAEYIDYKSDTEGRRFTGVIKGISDVGLLLVKDNDSGDIQEYGFKEIGYILYPLLSSHCSDDSSRIFSLEDRTARNKDFSTGFNER